MLKNMIYDFKQSKYEVAPKHRSEWFRKRNITTIYVLDIYMGVFGLLQSHLIAIGHLLKKYIQDEMKVDLEKEKCMFDEYIPEELDKVITRQHKVIEYQKKNDHKKLFSILIIVDDFADSKAFSRNSPLLNQLYVRGRHNTINIITATQKFNVLSPVIRVNSRQLFSFRLRNYWEIETMVEELSSVLIEKSSVADAKNLAEARNCCENCIT